ncbi:hypothetical protein [Nocardioides dongxiaopingii]|uniref:hypothetical protein n=1 Tax=Nocardioides dongxiaopingii TaxID=2576036 RepID=UPI0010C76BA2|nr:hypothetical protein [Nocardioides dongxiaopingii]
MGAGKAMVATLGTAVLRGDDEADVTIRTKGAWVGWLLVAGGLSMLAVVPRDGVVVGLGAGMAVAGWALFLRRPGAQQDLDSIEHVLRRELVGEWTRTDDDDGPDRRLPG